ncbi:MAG TPA: rhomboid family intramembrane serine protease [Bacilli bacterium]|nr:rhomboid family intramembrane serine protease [Bacilli bacterium]
MSTVVINKKDETVMRLVHYFVTKENYTPIVVTGAKDEIWLENQDAPYRIIRINSNYIHNKEQFNFDLFKTKSIIKQIKKKTLSFRVPTLNIFLNVNDGVKLTDEKYIDSLKLNARKDITKNKKLKDLFPNITKDVIDPKDSLDLVMNVTKDINKKTAKDNKTFEKIFSPKKIVVTKALIVINILIFIAMYIFGKGSTDESTLLAFGANYGPLVKSGEIYRLLTGAFLHIGLLHITFNMYALYIIGGQLESFLGKIKFLIIYLVSAIAGSLLSIIFSNSISAGASGAIFGLLGSLLYFGYHYRVYLGNVLMKQIVPLILLNIFLGFMLPGVDNAAHIGGLVAGLLCTMALGVSDKSTKSEKINGIVVLLLYFIFMIYMVFFK